MKHGSAVGAGSGGSEAWPDGVAAALAEVVARVRARRDELVRVVFDGVRRCPGYAELAGDDLARVEAGVATSVDLFISVFEAGRRVTPANLPAMRPLGAQRARLGVPLAGVLAGVSVGVGRAWEFFAEEAAALGCDRDRVAVLDAVDPWFAEALSAASDAMARGYLDERTPREGVAPTNRAALLAKLLADVVDDTHELECRAGAAGWEPSARHGLVLFAARTRSPVSMSVLAQARGDWVASMPGALGSALHVDPVPHAVAVAAVAPRGWDDATSVAGQVAERHGLLALVSDDTVGAGDVGSLYRSMVDIVALAADVAHTPRAITPAALCVFQLLAAIAPVERDATLGRVVARLRELQDSDDGRELLHTVEAVADLGGVVNAAAALGVHRRTVARRLTRLEEHLGVSFAARADRIVVELALHAMHFRDQPTRFDRRFATETPSDAPYGASTGPDRPQIARFVP